MCPLRPLPSSSCRLPVNGLATKHACVQPRQARVKGEGSIPRLPPARQSNRDQNGERLRSRPLRFTCCRGPSGAPACDTRAVHGCEHCWFTCFTAGGTKATKGILAPIQDWRKKTMCLD